MKKFVATLAVLPVLALAGHTSAALPASAPTTVHVGETVTFVATPCSPACGVRWQVTRFNPRTYATVILATVTTSSFTYTFGTDTVTVQERETRGNGTNGIVEQLQTTYVPVP